MIVGEHIMDYPLIFPWPDMVIILITWMIGIHIAIAAACCDCGSIHNYASYPFNNHPLSAVVTLWTLGRWAPGRTMAPWFPHWNGTEKAPSYKLLQNFI